MATPFQSIPSPGLARELPKYLLDYSEGSKLFEPPNIQDEVKLSNTDSDELDPPDAIIAVKPDILIEIITGGRYIVYDSVPTDLLRITLLTYRLFMTPANLMKQLQKRFDKTRNPSVFTGYYFLCLLTTLVIETWLEIEREEAEVELISQTHKFFMGYPTSIATVTGKRFISRLELASNKIYGTPKKQKTTTTTVNIEHTFFDTRKPRSAEKADSNRLNSKRNSLQSAIDWKKIGINATSPSLTMRPERTCQANNASGRHVIQTSQAFRVFAGIQHF